MNTLFWGLTIGVIGKLTIGIAVLVVHLKIFEEHKIDAVVLRSIRIEHVLTVLGIVCIIAGYMLELVFYNSLNLFSCAHAACGAALINAIH